MQRTPTPTEAMHNLVFKHNGTASAGINPARRAILHIIQNELGWTTSRDDMATLAHFRSRYAI
jgi:hypothetical protein